MFRIARFIVQHKVGAVAVIALGVVFFAPERGEQADASNPWSAPAQQSFAAAEEPGMLDQIVDKADTMLAESGMDPRETAEETVGRFDDTASRYESANAN
jgi:hypothetical protein